MSNLDVKDGSGLTLLNELAILVSAVRTPGPSLPKAL